MKAFLSKSKLFISLFLFLTTASGWAYVNPAYEYSVLKEASSGMVFASGGQRDIYGLRSFGNRLILYSWQNINSRPKKTQLVTGSKNAGLNLAPSLGVGTDEVLVAWQSIDKKLRPNVFASCFDLTGKPVSTITRLGSEKASTILPKVIRGSKSGEYFILIQELSGKFHLNLVHFSCQKGILGSKKIASTSRGNFFPVGSLSSKGLQLIFQTKNESRQDELFRVLVDPNSLRERSREKLSSTQGNELNAGFEAKGGYYKQVQIGGLWQVNFTNREGKQTILSDKKFNNVIPVSGLDNQKGTSFFWIQKDSKDKLIARWFNSSIQGLKKNHSILESSRISSLQILQYSGNFILLAMDQNQVRAIQVDKLAARPKASAQFSDSRISLKIKYPEDSKKIKAVAYAVDQRKDLTPEIWNQSEAVTTLNLPALGPGKYYFHIRYQDYAGNISGTTHLPIFVDLNNPIIESLSLVGEAPLILEEQTVKVEAKDDLGVASYEFILQSDTEKTKVISSQPKFQFTPEWSGRYTVKARAIDEMGKVSGQETVNIDVANVKEARIVSGPSVQRGNGSVLFRLIPEGSFKLEIKKYKSKKTLYEKKFIGNEPELEIYRSKLEKGLLLIRFHEDDKITFSKLIDNRSSLYWPVKLPSRIKLSKIEPMLLLSQYPAEKRIKVSFNGELYKKLSRAQVQEKLEDRGAYKFAIVKMNNQEYFFDGKQMPTKEFQVTQASFSFLLAPLFLTLFYFRSRLYFAFSRWSTDA